MIITAEQLGQIDSLHYNPFGGDGQPVVDLYNQLFPGHTYCITCKGDIHKMFQNLKRLSMSTKKNSPAEQLPITPAPAADQAPISSDVPEATATDQTPINEPAPAADQAPAVVNIDLKGDPEPARLLRFKSNSTGYRFHNQDEVYTNANLTPEIAEMILKADPSAKRLFEEL